MARNLQCTGLAAHSRSFVPPRAPLTGQGLAHEPQACIVEDLETAETIESTMMLRTYPHREVFLSLSIALLATPLVAQTGAPGKGGAAEARGAVIAPAEAQDSREAVQNSQKADKAPVKGRVFGGEAPLAAARVYAYEVASYAMRRVLTDRNGNFLFKTLPAGMYQIVAHKDGFAPTVELLLRRDPSAHQFVDLRMQEESDEDLRQAETYWDVRSKIPSDVLRDIQARADLRESTLLPGVQLEGTSVLTAEMVADSGVEELGGAYGEGQRTGAEVAVRGALGDMQVDISGQYQQLIPETTVMPEAQTQSLAVALESGGASKLTMGATSGEMTGVDAGDTMPVDLEHYHMSWSTEAGRHGRSGVKASYTSETNLHRGGLPAPVDIPGKSTQLDIEGFYRGELGGRTSLEAGLIYSQQSAEGVFGSQGFTGEALSKSLTGFQPGMTDDEILGLYGMAETRVQPKVLVEVGLFSTVREGGLSLTPQGGFVVELGNDWQARTSLSRRVDEDDDEAFVGNRFRSALFNDRNSCRQSGDACYEVMFSKDQGSQKTISLGAVHREFAETLRLYFSPDFFSRLESVFVVDGDSLPELQFSVVRQISPRVLARLESNIAAGGGGIFYATDDQAYENEVRYLVTSLDTRFQKTATGIFVAFHHLEQALNPVEQQKIDTTAAEVEMQRLQLMLTQDLSILTDVAANWAVRLNVELSRGATPYTLTPDDELHRKLTGGISVSF